MLNFLMFVLACVFAGGTVVGTRQVVKKITSKPEINEQNNIGTQKEPEIVEKIEYINVTPEPTADIPTTQTVIPTVSPKVTQKVERSIVRNESEYEENEEERNERDD